jgi:hypothetical protein
MSTEITRIQREPPLEEVPSESSSSKVRDMRFAQTALK